MEVLGLRELHGWEACSFTELALEGYRGQGFRASPLFQRQNLVAELLADGALVIHPGEDMDVRQRLGHLCAWMGAPILSLADLPAHPPATAEEAEELRARYNAERYLRELATTAAPATDRPRRPWEWARGLYARILRWEARVNAHLGHALKNPVCRELTVQPPRPYPTPQGPSVTTG